MNLSLIDQRHHNIHCERRLFNSDRSEPIGSVRPIYLPIAELYNDNYLHKQQEIPT
ncbi:MAG: hypothetical protein ICV85_13225 [Tolypothrix sp. T3-bin4]|nr:hypothetical protein [Tolypothrix sp. T3-bin4]